MSEPDIGAMMEAQYKMLRPLSNAGLKARFWMLMGMSKRAVSPTTALHLARRAAHVRYITQ